MALVSLLVGYKGKRHGKRQMVERASESDSPNAAVLPFQVVAETLMPDFDA